MAVNSFIEQNNIRVCLKRLPGCVRAFSMPNNDGYTVVVNDSLCQEARMKALNHELEHIMHNDHFNPTYTEYEE
jgi:hypothetical protein